MMTQFHVIKKSHKNFIFRYVLFFGFLGGVWSAIGFNPADEIFSVTNALISFLVKSPFISLFFALVPLLLLLFSIRIIYKKAGTLGLFSVLLGYFGGLMVLVSLKISLVLILSGAFIAIKGLRK
jgi:hypothetical protein